MALLADTRRAVRMYQKLNIPVFGLVETIASDALAAAPESGGPQGLMG
jgi:hypothetical protein